MNETATHPPTVPPGFGLRPLEVKIPVIEPQHSRSMGNSSSELDEIVYLPVGIRVRFSSIEATSSNAPATRVPVSPQSLRSKTTCVCEIRLPPGCRACGAYDRTKSQRNPSKLLLPILLHNSRSASRISSVNFVCTRTCGLNCPDVHFDMKT